MEATMRPDDFVAGDLLGTMGGGDMTSQPSDPAMFLHDTDEAHPNGPPSASGEPEAGEIQANLIDDVNEDDQAPSSAPTAPSETQVERKTRKRIVFDLEKKQGS